MIRKFFSTTLIFLAASTTLNLPSLASAAPPHVAPYEEGELLVKLRSNISGMAINQFSSIASRMVKPLGRASTLLNSSLGEWRSVKLAKGEDILLARAVLAQDPAIESVELNYVRRLTLTPNDLLFAKLWGLHNAGQSGGLANADIRATKAWEAHSDSRRTIVAVTDTGIAYDHPDLARNIWRNRAEIANNNIDDDKNGYVDDVYGYDFFNNDSNPYDDAGHGTHVAGVIGAVGNNGKGVVGVAWKVQLMALKICSEDACKDTDIINAILYAVKMGAKIINASWGGPGESKALRDAIAYANKKGVLIIASAGNNEANNDYEPFFPANYKLPNIISVTASDNTDVLAEFANIGRLSVDLAAPGIDIVSTVPIGVCWLCDASGYKSFDGTSMSAPYVAGAAALRWSRYPSAKHLEIKSAILESVDKSPSFAGLTVSEGRLNVSNLIPYYATPMTGDVNGDGKDDILAFDQQQAKVWIALSQGNHFGPAINTLSNVANVGTIAKVADVNGDGKDDIILFTQDKSLDVWVALATRDGFFSRPTIWHETFARVGETFDLGDFNGDSRADLIRFSQDMHADVKVALSSGVDFGAINKWHAFFAPPGQTPAIGDINGDGYSDIIAFTQDINTDVLVAFSNGATRFSGEIKWHDRFAKWSETPRMGDFNGDGKQDIISFTQGSNADVVVALSDGTKSFRGGRIWHNNFAPIGEVPWVGDIDGDGKDDIITFRPEVNSDVWAALSQSTSFANAKRWHNNFGL